MRVWLWILVFILPVGGIRACIWDADSLFVEKHRSHDLAAAILGDPEAIEDPQKLQARINDLESHRNEASADWWNNLAGAHLRLNQPAVAVKLLEPVAAKFPNDYGIHANLGTAYHLLGRYADAEKEIARDLEINPDAHFGLEKYHLALLQYLMRDAGYQARHLYVDEFTPSFLHNSGGHYYYVKGDQNLANDFPITDTPADLERQLQMLLASTNANDDYLVTDLLREIAATDPKPDYRNQWDLAENSNLVDGVIYMAQMNQKEPACFTMLGVVAWKKHDSHLAISAFEKAISLGSPQSRVLQGKIRALHHFIDESFKEEFGIWIFIGGFFVIIPLMILYYIYTKIRDRWIKKMIQP